MTEQQNFLDMIQHLLPWQKHKLLRAMGAKDAEAVDAD